jgi:hypothetical protein
VRNALPYAQSADVMGAMGEMGIMGRYAESDDVDEVGGVDGQRNRREYPISNKELPMMKERGRAR